MHTPRDNASRTPRPLDKSNNAPPSRSASTNSPLVVPYELTTKGSTKSATTANLPKGSSKRNARRPMSNLEHTTSAPVWAVCSQVPAYQVVHYKTRKLPTPTSNRLVANVTLMDLNQPLPVLSPPITTAIDPALAPPRDLPATPSHADPPLGSSTKQVRDLSQHHPSGDGCP